VSQINCTILFLQLLYLTKYLLFSIIVILVLALITLCYKTPRVFLRFIVVVSKSSTLHLYFVTITVMSVGCAVTFWRRMDLQWMQLLQRCFVLVFTVLLTLALAAVFTWSSMTS